MIFIILCLQSSYNRTQKCTPRRTLFDLKNSTYDSIIGSSRPVFVRMENEGCPYAKTSKYYWEEAAQLFPTIQFARAECIYNREICNRLGATVSPSHALFGPNSQTPLDSFGNPSAISSSSNYYSDVIYRHLGFYPIDTSTITELLPQSTNFFFESYKYPIFILYDSSCEEDSDFISRWIIDVTDGKISSEDYGFGRLDCSIYPDECLKWGAKVPSANVYSRDKAISVSIKENDNIANRVKSVVSFLNKSDIVYPTPLPFEIPQPTQPPEITDVKTITLTDLQNRNVDTIRNKYNQAKKRSYEGDDFTGAADVYSCNNVQLKEEAYSDVVRLVNFYRELAGLSTDVTNDASLNEGCYYAAKYSSRIGAISHETIDFYRKECDFESHWDQIKTSLQKSNLAQGETNVLPMISGLIDDEGSNNEDAVGHRRWLLYPFLKTIGIGFYPHSKHQMQGYVMSYPSCGAFSVSHGSLSNAEFDSFISWPPPGPFPIERLPTSWSVYYKEFHKEDVNISNIVVRLTRDDGKILEYSKINLDKSSFGLSGQIVFKLKDDSLELITAGHSVHVQVYFLKDSTREVLDYTIDFFDDLPQESVCFYDKDKSKCPDSIPDSNKYGNGQYLNYKPSNENIARTIIHVAEDITVSNDLRFDYSQYIIVKGNKINGKIIIGTNNDVDIHDPSSTDFVIEVDPSNFQCGILRTSTKAKSIKVSFTRQPTTRKRVRSLFYIGSYTNINVTQQIAAGDYIYYFGLSYKESETYLVCTPIINVEYLCQGDQYFYDDYIDSSINCRPFNELSELRQIKSNKKIIKVYSDGIFEISVRSFPKTYADYYFYSGNSLTLEYSPVLEERTRLINISNFRGRELNPKFLFSQLPHGTPYLYNEVLKNVFPFKNLYLSNLGSSVKRNGYMVPNLLGDEQAKSLLAMEESEIYDESSKPFANSNGAYNYPSKSYNGGVPYNPLFITNGVHDEYTFTKSDDDALVNLRIKSTDSSSSKPVAFHFSSGPSPYQKIFIMNYEDVTITSDDFSSIRLMNVSKARFIDANNKQVKGICTDVIGSNDIDLSSSSDNPVIYRELYFRTNHNVDLENCKCSETTVVESNPTIRNLDIQNLHVVYSKTKFVNCNINGKIEFYLYYDNVPSINIRENTTFDPTEIKITIYDYPYSKSLLSINKKELGDELSLLIEGLDPQKADSILSKITIVDIYNSLIDDYKVIPTKDKQGFYMVDKEFDESKAPETVIIDDEDDENLIFDENYELNDPPPNVPLNTNDKKGKKKLSKILIIEIVVGVVVVVIIIVLIIILVIKLRKKKQEKEKSSENEEIEEENELNDSVGL